MTLKEARLARGLTQLELAYKARVALTTLHAAENGHGTPRPATREAIAHALEVEAGDIWPEHVR